MTAYLPDILKKANCIRALHRTSPCLSGSPALTIPYGSFYVPLLLLLTPSGIYTAEYPLQYHSNPGERSDPAAFKANPDLDI